MQKSTIKIHIFWKKSVKVPKKIYFILQEQNRALYPEKMILYFPLHFSLLCGERRQLQPNNSFWEMGLWNLFVIFTWRRIERCHDVIAKRGKILKSFSTTHRNSAFVFMRDQKDQIIWNSISIKTLMILSSKNSLMAKDQKLILFFPWKNIQLTYKKIEWT